MTRRHPHLTKRLSGKTIHAAEQRPGCEVETAREIVAQLRIDDLLFSHLFIVYTIVYAVNGHVENPS